MNLILLFKNKIYVNISLLEVWEQIFIGLQQKQKLYFYIIIDKIKCIISISRNTANKHVKTILKIQNRKKIFAATTTK